MIALHTHGPVFLSREEQRAALKPKERWFYEGLGRQWLRELRSAPDEQFWDYQRWCLGAAGQQLQRWRVWKGATQALARSLLADVRQLRR